jgi:small subunit ribosomal protein S19e
MFAKTCAGRERQPVNPDWWYVRAASVLRRVALVGPVGTEKLRTHYGGRKNRGHKPERFYKASGNVLRTILKQLDKAGLTKPVEKGQNKGRIITAKGQELLYSLSDQIMAEKAKSQSS